MANRFATSTALSRPLTWNALAQCLVFARNRAVESDLAASARPHDRHQAGLTLRGTGWVHRTDNVGVVSRARGRDRSHRSPARRRCR